MAQQAPGIVDEFIQGSSRDVSRELGQSMGTDRPKWFSMLKKRREDPTDTGESPNTNYLDELCIPRGATFRTYPLNTDPLCGSFTTYDAHNQCCVSNNLALLRSVAGVMRDRDPATGPWDRILREITAWATGQDLAPADQVVNLDSLNQTDRTLVVDLVELTRTSCPIRLSVTGPNYTLPQFWERYPGPLYLSVPPNFPNPMGCSIHFERIRQVYTQDSPPPMAKLVLECRVAGANNQHVDELRDGIIHMINHAANFARRASDHVPLSMILPNGLSLQNIRTSLLNDPYNGWNVQSPQILRKNLNVTHDTAYLEHDDDNVNKIRVRIGPMDPSANQNNQNQLMLPSLIMPFGSSGGGGSGGGDTLSNQALFGSESLDVLMPGGINN